MISDRVGLPGPAHSPREVMLIENVLIYIDERTSEFVLNYSDEMTVL